MKNLLSLIVTILFMVSCSTGSINEKGNAPEANGTEKSRPDPSICYEYYEGHGLEVSAQNSLPMIQTDFQYWLTSIPAELKPDNYKSHSDQRKIEDLIAKFNELDSRYKPYVNEKTEAIFKEYFGVDQSMYYQTFGIRSITRINQQDEGKQMPYPLLDIVVWEKEIPIEEQSKLMAYVSMTGIGGPIHSSGKFSMLPLIDGTSNAFLSVPENMIQVFREFATCE